MVFIRGVKAGAKGIFTATKLKVLLPDITAARAVNVLDVDGAIFLAASIPVLAQPAASDRPDEMVKAIENELSTVAELFHPKPVWIKLTSISNKKLLAAQLGATAGLVGRGWANVKLLAPSLHSGAEIGQLRDAMAVAGLRLPLGLMLETPAGAFLVDEMAKSGIALACIDIDRLSQHMLAHDGPKFTKVLHPAVAAAAEQTIKNFKRYKIKTGVQTARPSAETLSTFVRAGVDMIAVPPSSLPTATYLVARAETALQLQFARDWVLKRI